MRGRHPPWQFVPPRSPLTPAHPPPPPPPPPTPRPTPTAIYFSCFPSDRRHLNAVMQKIKTQKGKERLALDKNIAQQGGSLEGAMRKGKK